MTQQEASDAVGEATVARYNEWDDVVEKLPSWGPETDEMVAKYIEMSRITVVSNIEWRSVQPCILILVYKLTGEKQFREYEILRVEE